MQDYRAGVLAAWTVNAQGGWKDRLAEPKDFFPSLGERREQTPEEQLFLLRLLTAEHGGTDLTSGSHGTEG